jgi:cell division transport system ATP-binding protein
MALDTIIRFENAGIFIQDHLVLSDVNFQVNKGEFVYLIGKVGTGKTSIVFQDFQLLTDRSVTENLAFVLKATGWKEKPGIDKRIGEVLERVGLGTKGYKMPNQLSGGEQQRVVIARALLNDPEIILADEPTGNLDPETSNDIMEILTGISKNGRAVVMATHNYHLIEKYPSRTLKCEKGKLV